MALVKLIRLLKTICLVVALIAFGCAALTLASKQQDDQAILQAVSGQLLSKPGTGMFIEELNRWVYHNQGFKKNGGFFLLKALGPTPRQVLEHGGDCADKSRLLSTILGLYGVDSTLVTLLGCPRCGPTHIVVEARYERGWMVADPVFDMVFPEAGFTYHDVEDLKADPSILSKRLDQLARIQGPRGKAAHYRRQTETYSWAQYINWDKYAWSQGFARMMSRFGVDLHAIRRPAFLENPKLVVSSLAAAIGTGALLLWLAMAYFAAALTGKPTACTASEQGTRCVT